MNILDFTRMKQAGHKITMVTCYDYWSASIIDQTSIDCVLVGDSAAMIMHGHSTTVNATVEMMVAHTEAVVRGAPSKFIVADMPFLSYRKDLKASMDAVQRLMQAGAHAIKLEGVLGNEALIKHIVDSGVPVMGHIGLTPQSVHQLGGWKVQGKDSKAAQAMLEQAETLQALGCFSVVMELVPAPLAEKITQTLDIATIGIGAGAGTDGQVLVLQDLLGMNQNFKPKFLKQYMDGFSQVANALSAYCEEVKNQQFPTEKHSFGVSHDQDSPCYN